MKVMKKSFTAKLLTVMRICAVQGVLALTLCGVSIAHTHYAQVLDRPVTLNVSEVTFERALHEIESAANVKFAYSPDQLIEEQSVTLYAENKTLRAILDELLIPRKITYKVHEREASITLKKQNGDEDDQSLLEKSEIKPQPPFLIQITGTITEATSQQPMAGVNVIVKGTTNGTTTDSEGRYSIGADEGDILIFSFIGYASQEIRVTSQSVVDVVMLEDVKSLNEVVVNAGYYTTTKETQTGSIGKVEAADIQKQPVSNPLAALQARVPGLEVVQQTGVPGGNFRVRIRGQNSIANGNDPLFIVDGVPYTSTSQSFAATSDEIFPGGFGTSPLNYINPFDIESIEVLKDADATSLYGSRGANGVILITTKKGKKGEKTLINLNYAEGFGNVAGKMRLLNTDQYLTMRDEAFANDGITPTEANAPDLLLWDASRNTDWQEELIGGTSRYRDAQLSLSGGEKNTFISAGVGYHNETTVFPGDNSDRRLSAHVTAKNTSPNGKLTTTVIVNYAFNNTDFIKRDLTRESLILQPNAPPLLVDGELNWGPGSWTSSNPNPLTYTKRSYESNTNSLVGNLSLSYALLPNVEIKFNGGGTSIVNRSLTLDPASSYDPAVSGFIENSSAFSSNYFTNWIAEPQIHTDFKIGKGRLLAMVGTSFMSQLSEGNSQYATGFANESLMRNISSANEIIQSGSIYNLYRYHAVFGRINYSLNEKYFVNLTARRDGSSRFGPGKKFSNFGAVGLAWLFSREPFIPEFLSLGKVRVSYGISGNDQIGDYQYLDTYSSEGSGIYDGVRGLSPQRLFNEDFAWEKIKKAEIGVDLGLFENRITATLAYYQNRSSSQLLSNNLPPTTGFGSIQSNLPATVQNTGLEIELNSINVKTKSFTFSTNFNITVPKNELVEFPNLENAPQYSYRLEVGEPLSMLKVYRHDGIDPTTGMYVFQDENNDGEINSLDRQTIKSYGQNLYGGLSNNISYKNFQLEFRFQFVKQSGYNYLSYFTSAPGNPVNQPGWVVNRWQETGSSASIQRYSTTSDFQNAYNNYLVSDRSITDASFIRLKNVSLSYSLSPSILKKIKMQDVKFFVQGQNVITVTSYQGLDPETQSSSLPPLRVLTTGIHATF